MDRNRPPTHAQLGKRVYDEPFVNLFVVHAFHDEGLSSLAAAAVILVLRGGVRNGLSPTQPGRRDACFEWPVFDQEQTIIIWQRRGHVMSACPKPGTCRRA